MPFWAEKLVHTLLEAVVLGYTRNLVFPRRIAKTSLAGMIFSALSTSDSADSPPPQPASPQKQPAAPEKQGFFSSMFKPKNSAVKEKEKAPVLEVVSSGPSNSYNAGRCVVDAESLGRIAQDINTLNSFFSKKAGQATATDYLEILNDVSLMLFTELDNVIKHAINRISVFPSAAEVFFYQFL